MTNIKKLRTLLGLSQADFARRINTHTSNACRLETGTTKAGQRVRARVAKALDTDPDELFDGDGWPLEAETVNV